VSKAMLVDTSACLACNACTVECKRENGVVVGKDIFWTRIQTHEVGQYPTVRQYPLKRACNHCTEAACLSVCPTGALSRHEEGFVVLNQDKCNGCGYCTQACPFGIPQLDVMDQLSGKAKANKCSFCVERTSNGGQTACAATCPFGAITYGERDDLLSQGKARVAALQAKGKSKANLYGENQMGGLHVLYVLEDTPEAYSLPSQPQMPAGVTLWQRITRPAGEAVIGLAAVGVLAAFATARRNVKIGEEEGVGEHEGD